MKNKSFNWVSQGLLWGFLTFILMQIIYPYVIQDKITVESLLRGVIVWTIAGLVFGYVMKIVYEKRERKRQQEHPHHEHHEQHKKHAHH